MIIFKPLIENIKEYQRGNLSENAVRLNTPHSIDETLKKAAPITAVLSIVLFLAMFIKTIVEHDLVINPIAFVFGFIFGFLFYWLCMNYYTLLFTQKMRRLRWEN